MTATSTAMASAIEQVQLVRTGAATPLELVDAAIARLEGAGAELNVLASERFERGREEARSDDLPDGPLRGLPILLKDIWCWMEGESDYMGNQILKQHDVRAPVDAAVTRRLREAGAIVLGRTTTPEFAIRSTTESLASGATKNPWSPAHSTGGSSGGSAAAVAAGLVPLALGSDGAGSLRMPAALCGTVTLKPSHGRISMAPDGAPMAGHAEYGALTRTIEDQALFLDVVSGPEPGDPTSLAAPSRPFSDPVELSATLRVGMVTADSLGGAPLDPDCLTAVREVAEALSGLGHTITDEYPAAYGESEYLDHFIDTLAPGVVGILDYLGSVAGRPVDPAEVEPETRYWYERGLGRSGAELTGDIMWLDGYRRRMASWWEEGNDLLLAPSFMRASLPFGEIDVDVDSVRPTIDLVRATAPFNTTGQPALTVPATLVDGLPVGVQIVAAFGREDLLLQVGRQLQEKLGWTERRPPQA